MKITWRNLPCVLGNILAIIRNTTGLSFVLKRIGLLAATIYFHCYLLVIALFIITKIPKQLPFSVYSETLLRTIYQYLLLLIGFDTLTYWKSDDGSPTLVGHHTSPYQGGGRARPTLSGCVGSQALQSLVISSKISPELCFCSGSLSLGLHRPQLRTWKWTSSLRGRDVLVDYSRCVSYIIWYYGCINWNIR